MIRIHGPSNQRRGLWGQVTRWSSLCPSSCRIGHSESQCQGRKASTREHSHGPIKLGTKTATGHCCPCLLLNRQEVKGVTTRARAIDQCWFYCSAHLRSFLFQGGDCHLGPMLAISLLLLRADVSKFVLVCSKAVPTKWEVQVFQSYLDGTLNTSGF